MFNFNATKLALHETLSHHFEDSDLYAIGCFNHFRHFSFFIPSRPFCVCTCIMVGGIMYAYIVGSLFIIVGLSFLTNQYVKFTSYMLVVLMLIFILSIHLPNYLNAGNRDTEIAALINILKDAAIMGFVLHIAAGAHHQHLHFEESD